MEKNSPKPSNQSPPLENFLKKRIQERSSTWIISMTPRRVTPTLGWLLEEIHVTWAHMEKKQTRLRLYTKSLEEVIIQNVETVSPTLATASELDQDGVRSIKTVSECSRLK
ncbi:hypothetical protein Tco_0804612 [Tanacetum coccineum]|uniref:Uncharacterized protein n=1 Tax=Tanacetum coccineum TaxID=301880 RepID=A0ABQ5A4S4_9ASTR